jgi:hypothetical protein
MAKKHGALGKLIAFTTAVAAIGGVCYVFRDKIKESETFKKASDKSNDLYDSVKSKMNNDDFTFDDDWDYDNLDDDFDDDGDSTSAGSREYTSLSPAAKEDNAFNDDDSVSDSIPIINIKKENDDNEVAGYENEGLSDTSEDPDVLEEQDKLDF